jgi:hypothetical protein
MMLPSVDLPLSRGSRMDPLQIIMLQMLQMTVVLLSHAPLANSTYRQMTLHLDVDSGIPHHSAITTSENFAMKVQLI